MSRDTVGEAGLLAPRKIALQLLGFAMGAALLGWCVWVAVRGGGDQWDRIRTASPWLVAGLAACSLVSMTVNGVMFWLVIQPVRRLQLGHMVWLNYVTGVLNYAPIRAGLIARVAYHLRVDRLGVLEIGAWLGALTYTLVLAVGACLVATIARPTIDLVWLALLAGMLLIGGLLTRALVGQTLVMRLGRGLEQMLRQPLCLWGAIALRLIDIGAFVGRMACAAAILGLTLSVSETVILGIAALALSLNPLGRTGFREAAVAFVASHLAGDLSGAQLDSDMAALALIESAGEAIVAIPCGAAALFWYRRRWREAGKGSPQTPDAA